MQTDKQKGPFFATKYTTQEAFQTASVKDLASGIAILGRCYLKRKIVIKPVNPLDCLAFGNILV